jgi:hypothetical protein
MAWLEFHAAEIKRLQKFRDFRVELNWSVNEALGFLGNLWGEVLTLREDGDIRSWRPDYIAELTGVRTPPDKLWAALTAADRWLDVKEDGRVLVHDWLDYAGPYLKSRYRRAKLRRLLEIWALHGREYKLSTREQEELAKQDAAGEEGLKTAARQQPGYSQASPCNRTVPDLTGPNQRKTTAPSAVDLARGLAEKQERDEMSRRSARDPAALRLRRAAGPLPEGDPAGRAARGDDAGDPGQAAAPGVGPEQDAGDLARREEAGVPAVSVMAAARES